MSLAGGGRNATLDALRGIAILLVLGRHQANALLPANAGVLKLPAGMWFQIGWSGVDLFFVLSGFLVGGLLLREGRESRAIDARRFLIRRLLKLWPQYYTFVIIVTLLAGVSYGFEPALRNMWPAFFHVQNIRMTPEHHLWSLAVEEHFYLLLAGYLAWLQKRVRPARHGVVIGVTYLLLAAGAFYLRYTLAARFPLRWTISVPTPFRIDCLFLGVALAWGWSQWRGRLSTALNSVPLRLLLLGLALVLALPIFFLPLESDTLFIPIYGFLMLSWASALVLLTCYAGDLLKGRFFLPLRFIGFYSFGVYLWHVKCRDIALYLLGKLSLSAGCAWLVCMGIYLLLAVGLGVLTTKLIELPVLRLREKIAPPK